MSYTPPPPPPDEDGSGDGSGQTPPGYGESEPPGYGTPPPPPGYGQTSGGSPTGGVPKNSTKAVLSLVIGISSVVLGLCCAFIGLVGIAAIVLGRQAQSEIAASGGMQLGAGMAKAGFVLGIVGTAIAALMTILNVMVFTSGGGPILTP